MKIDESSEDKNKKDDILDETEISEFKSEDHGVASGKKLKRLMYNKSVDKYSNRSASVKSGDDFWEEIEPKVNLFAKLHDFSVDCASEDLCMETEHSPMLKEPKPDKLEFQNRIRNQMNKKIQESFRGGRKSTSI